MQIMLIHILISAKFTIQTLEMNTFLSTLIIIFVAFLVSFVLINLRHVVTGKEFRGTCATNNPMIKDQMGECTICGKKPEEACKMPEVKKA